MIVSIFALALLPLPSTLAAPAIRVQGHWKQNIDQTKLLAGAGSDLQSSYESAVNQLGLSISNVSSSWRVNAHRVDINWHPLLNIFVRRCSNGRGNGKIAGGTAQLLIDIHDRSFFEGTLPRSQIDIQVRLTGISLKVPPNNYETAIVFTVLEG
jgi:hypothetical protein